MLRHAFAKKAISKVEEYWNKIHQRALVTPVRMLYASVITLELSVSARSGSERDSFGEESLLMECDLCIASECAVKVENIAQFWTCWSQCKRHFGGRCTVLDNCTRAHVQT